MKKHIKRLNCWELLSDQSKTEYIEILEAAVAQHRRRKQIVHLVRRIHPRRNGRRPTWRRISAPSPELVIINAVILMVYLTLVNPPISNILMIPTMFGASLSTLIISYSAADGLLAFFQRIMRRSRSDNDDYQYSQD